MRTSHKGGRGRDENNHSHRHKRPPIKTNPTKKFEGVISITAKGSGYVTSPDFNDDVFIDVGLTGPSLHNDTVLFSTDDSRGNTKVSGRVLEVKKRNRSEFVCTSKKENGRTVAVADWRKIHTQFLIDDNTPENKKILVSLTSWENPNNLPNAKVLKIIGNKGDNTAEMHSVVIDRGFSPTFNEGLEDEAQKVKTDYHKNLPQEVNKRRDLRQDLTFTIDPVDAKDFDDAISIKNMPNGHFEIGVHIADVSHFVCPNTLLDEEAQKRCTSIYLVDRTIPMLPEILSNDLCSLNPNEDKFTFSIIFEIDRDGKIYSEWFGKTIIHSNKRFTYEEAQESIEGKSDLYREELKILNNIAKSLHKSRFKKGAISFEQDEVKFILDENGRPLKVIRKTRVDAHKLVEEFMLLANRQVAAHINKLHKEKSEGQTPLFLYRIHDVPDYEKIAELSIFVRALGYELDLKDGHVKGKDLNALFEKLEGKAEEAIIKTAAIRSMAKAIYSTKNIGHYGLAFDYYTHFTSPIRRYPDVLVHRLLSKYLTGQIVSKEEFGFYEKMASQATEAEIRASEAERESIKIKQVEFMREKLGEVREGIISGVTEWGFYIEDKETKSEGLVRLKDLRDDYYNLDSKNYRLVGERNKKTYSLGDKVLFKVTGGDTERRVLDFSLA